LVIARFYDKLLKESNKLNRLVRLICS